MSVHACPQGGGVFLVRQAAFCTQNAFNLVVLNFLARSKFWLMHAECKFGDQFKAEGAREL
jgi:hypothetical protein